MKKIMFYTFYATCILCFSCKKKEGNEVIEPVLGTISNLSANGKPFPRNGYTLDVSGSNNPVSGCNLDVYSITIYHNSDTLQDQILLTSLPKNKFGKILLGTSTFASCQTKPYASLYIKDDDVLRALYQPLKTADNFLNIESYNEKTGDIKGNFDVTFVISEKGVDYRNSLPDTVRFVVSSFSLRLQ